MSGDTKKQKLLIVDDDAFLLSMYSHKFSGDGYEVMTARDATEFFTEISNGFMPDVVLIDVLMPGDDGFTVLEKLASDSQFKSLVKIMLSNLGQESDVKKALGLGADGYIIKAVNSPTEVIAKVRDIINNSKK